jgi:hypothetical protein
VVTTTPQKRLKDTKKKIAELADNFHLELNAVSLAAARKNQLHTNILIGQLSNRSDHAFNANLPLPRPHGFVTNIETMSIESSTNPPLAIEGSVVPKSVIKINIPASNLEFLGREAILTKLHDRL